jgi:hypothetical protein
LKCSFQQSAAREGTKNKSIFEIILLWVGKMIQHRFNDPNEKTEVQKREGDELNEIRR